MNLKFPQEKARMFCRKKRKRSLNGLSFYNTIAKKNVLHTGSYFGISSKTLYKWLRRFDEKNLKSLEEQSRRPQKVRVWMVGTKI